MPPRCADCPHTHRQVGPDGPKSARVMVIGEGPGVWEDRSGVPFCGKAGQELDETYLKLAGLERSEVWATNVVQCRQERNGVDVKPGEALAACCAANHLGAEIEQVQPSVIVLCGTTACSLLGSVDLELEHGFPRLGVLFGYEATIVPMYHPAAGLHETRYMTPMLEDWERLGLWRRGLWMPPKPSIGEATDYRFLQTWKEDPQRQVVAVDTESDEGKPYSVQISLRAGHGRFVLATNAKVLDRLRGWIRGCEVVLHNAAYDLEMLDRMGIRVDRFRDTMQELYHLGNLPQGLKAAVYRVFGYRMTSYDEVVTPYSKAVLENWLAEALAHASSSLGEAHPHPKGPDCPTCGKKHRLDVSTRKPHESEAVLRRVMSRIDSDYDPWQAPKLEKGAEKPRLLGREWLAEIEEAVGRLPRRSIVHAPLEQQIQYACSDADWTGRLAVWLEGERARIVEHEWKVA
mgnify:CR=1 FL=1